MDKEQEKVKQHTLHHRRLVTTGYSFDVLCFYNKKIIGCRGSLKNNWMSGIFDRPSFALLFFSDQTGLDALAPGLKTEFHLT